MTSREIRETFLRFFESQGHTRVASSSWCPPGPHPAVHQCRDGTV